MLFKVVHYIGIRAMLGLKHVSKHYRSIPAVEDVSFVLKAGEILGYLGPNGAGKSTTVKMIIGLIQPNAGRVLFHGRDVRENLKDFQHRIGYVPEEPHLYPHLSGREIV